MTVIRARALQVPIAVAGTVALGGLLVTTVWRDIETPVRAWYYRSTPVWLAVMAIATLIYVRERRALVRAGVDVDARFAALPPE